MRLYHVRKFQISSLMKGLPIIFTILGAIIGIFTFFIMPTNLAVELGAGARTLAWLIFVIMYVLIMTIGAMFTAFLYNCVAQMVGGVVISLEPKE